MAEDADELSGEMHHAHTVFPPTMSRVRTVLRIRPLKTGPGFEQEEKVRTRIRLVYYFNNIIKKIRIMNRFGLRSVGVLLNLFPFYPY